MKEIRVEETKFIYFTKSDGYPREKENGLLVRGRSLFMEEQAKKDFYDIRTVLTKWIDPHVVFLHYLFWDDGSDLDLLDLKVMQDTFSDEDFANSIKTTYQLTRCGVCLSEWHTLVVDLDAYFDKPGLARKKLAKRAIKLCPNCGAMLRQLVVKIW